MAIMKNLDLLPQNYLDQLADALPDHPHVSSILARSAQSGEEIDGMWAESISRLLEYTKVDGVTASTHMNHMNLNYQSIRFLTMVQNKPAHLCKECGAVEVPGRYVQSTQNVLFENMMCFGCSYWLDMAFKHTQQPFIIINHTVYFDEGRRDNIDEISRSGLGHTGREFVIRLFDENRTILETNNLWRGDDIPVKYRELMNDNAEFLSKNAIGPVARSQPT